jgi:hypothetical protein
MPQKYFEPFPIITYANNEVVDITKRATILDKVSSNPYVFYPYEITSEERPDQLSFRYYEDQYKSWIIYLTNKIVDPYYEWYLHNSEFEQFIEKKYGSIYNSQNKVKRFVNNWIDQERLEPAGYNALTSNQKKYWVPEYGRNNAIIFYTRKEIDWYINTNHIVAYAVSNTSLIKDEVCEIIFNNFEKGRGQVLKTTNTHVYLQHVSGYFSTSQGVSISGLSRIYGNESKVNTAITSLSEISSNIPPEEYAYWKPQTYFEYETEKNEFNKTIRVLDSDFKQIISDDLVEKMKE